MGRLLFDLSDAPACCTDHALEALYKSLSDRPDDGIWRAHHDPWVSAHIEDVTRRGQTILRAVQLVLAPEDLSKANRFSSYTEAQLDVIGARLHSKTPSEYTPDDWFDLVDWALAIYLPDDTVDSLSEFIAVRSVLAGRIQAVQDKPLPAAVAAALMQASPATVVAAAKVITFTGRVGAVLRFARRRAADLIVDLGDDARKRMRRVILRHEEQRALGGVQSASMLQSDLFDEFDALNRDWRRIAVTEVGRDANEGFIATIPPGSRVKRLERYADACPFCSRIHGMVFDVVDPAKPDKDGWAEVWSGKSNEGRSASPRKRVGDELIERAPDELWWPAAGVQHPHCRGTWVKEVDAIPGVDPEFKRWVDAQIAAVTP